MKGADMDMDEKASKASAKSTKVMSTAPKAEKEMSAKAEKISKAKKVTSAKAEKEVSPKAEKKASEKAMSTDLTKAEKVTDALEYVALSMPPIDEEAMIDYVYEDMSMSLGLGLHQ